MKKKFILSLLLWIFTSSAYGVLPKQTEDGLDLKDTQNLNLSKKLSISRSLPSEQSVSAIVDDGTPLTMSAHTDVDGPPVQDEFLEDTAKETDPNKEIDTQESPRLLESQSERNHAQTQKKFMQDQTQELAAIASAEKPIAIVSPKIERKADRIPEKHVTEVLERIRITYAIAKKFQVAVDYRSSTKRQLEKYAEKLEKFFSEKAIKDVKAKNVGQNPDEASAEI